MVEGNDISISDESSTKLDKAARDLLPGSYTLRRNAVPLPQGSRYVVLNEVNAPGASPSVMESVSLLPGKDWPVLHVARLFSSGMSGLIERKSKTYRDSWRRFGPRGMVNALDRKYERIIGELWDGEDYSHEKEPITEVIDDCIVHLLHMRQLITENPNDITGKEYRHSDTTRKGSKEGDHDARGSS